MSCTVFGMISTEKSKAYTEYALKTFFSTTHLQAEDEFHLIENDSGSLDCDKISQLFPKVTFHVNSSPLSFAKNMNLVLGRANELSADAILLNNDIIFSNNWLAPLLGPKHKILVPVSNAQFAYSLGNLHLKLSMSLSDYIGNEATFEQIVVEHQKQTRGLRLAHSLPFYCVRIPQSVYSLVGFLDEAYSIAGFEDSDYTLRCWEQGIPSYYVLDSLILHFYGKSSWTADSGPPPIDPDPKIGRRGEMLFRKRWSDPIAEIFAVQNGRGLLKLRELENQALANLYSQLAKQARAYREKHGQFDEP